ncbi:GntR family transcriptional regulator [Streptomyces sp. 549]|uniref:GntR family transcriptional regulator n=1 Tax=Streptomyces sp. 549 TaxID=3049076 RepID=UPI0024C39832|nr:GntR family transcriptional regulator [Streptomyces sp. 549]MDK1472337.1 GntR family transcriptional regulator [Streptomyces sp. 549]
MALPKYEQLAADLRGRIVRGELKPGETIPSERELTERWAVSRATVVKGLEVLRQEGLIDTRQGTGSIVRERVPLARTAGERYRTSVKTGNIYTAGEYAEILSAEMVPAPDHVATALGITPGDHVVRRHRVTYEGQTPTATSCSWFTQETVDAAPRLLQRERVREGTTRYVEMQTGRRPHSGRDWWTARLATDEELELLRLAGPQAVAESRHVAFCEEGRPLAYEVGISPAGRWSRTEEYSMVD